MDEEPLPDDPEDARATPDATRRDARRASGAAAGREPGVALARYIARGPARVGGCDRARGPRRNRGAAS